MAVLTAGKQSQVIVPMSKFWVARVFGVLFLVLAANGVVQAERAADAQGNAYYAKGLAARTAHQFGAAAADFEQALLHGHTDPGTFYQLGLTYQQLKRLNDAAWAFSIAVADPVYAALTPAAQRALQQIGQQGGASVGPPALLKNVKETPATITPELDAAIESRAATTALQGNGTYFAAPVFGKQVTAISAGALTQAAADLQNNSSTGAKFVFLSGTPAPYTSLADYARDLFTVLKLKRAVVVVITPQAAGAYSDRLNAASMQRTTQDQIHAVGISASVALAAGIARAATTSADDAEASNAHRTTILGVAFALVLLAAVSVAIWKVGWGDTARASRGALRPQTRSRS